MKRIPEYLGATAILSLALVAVAWSAPKARPYTDSGVANARDVAPLATARTARPLNAEAAFTDAVAAATAIGNRIVSLQSDVTEDNAGNGNPDLDNNDGGWDWEGTGQTRHSDGPSTENLYGPIARGLVDAAVISGDPRLAIGAGDVFSGISRPGVGATGFPYFRLYDGDIGTAYVRWANHTGNAALNDTLRARHDQEMSIRGGVGGRARTVRNGRAGQGLAGLWPWDINGLANDCDALRAAFPGSAAQYGAELDSVAQVILDDRDGLLGPNGWNLADFGQSYHQLGITGALRTFDASPRTDDDAFAPALRDSLVNGQFADGSWGVSYDGVFYAQDLQTTSYAVLALMEYSARHADAVARAAAARGQQFLLGYVSPTGVVNDGWGEFVETAAEVATALLTGDPVSPQAPATCITPLHACVEVPVNFSRIDTTPVRGYSVTLTLGGGLNVCGGVTQGSYLSSVGATHYEALDLGGGVWSVDCVILGGNAGATGSGTLFTLNLGGTGTGTGTVTVNSVRARDLSNVAVSALPGPPVSLTIDNSAPAAMGTLAAAQRKLGNDGDGSTKIDLTWPGYTVEAGASVEVYRKGFGGYPGFDDAGGSVPAPVGYPPAGWTPVTLAAGGSGYTDEPATRDFWYYVAFVKDPCGNVSATSNGTGGTLNYHLGDVAGGLNPGDGNNLVDMGDISALGFSYGLNVTPDIAFLDVGPTTNFSVNARPTTDNKINFEDLMMFAINFGVAGAPQDRPALVAAGANALAVTGVAATGLGETFTLPVRMSGAGDVQGASIAFAYDPAVVQFVSAEAGDLLRAQGRQSLVLSPAAGVVDVALLGAGAGVQGEGTLVNATFRRIAEGEPGLALRSVTLRDAANQPVGISAAKPALPALSWLGSAYPNPFRGRTSLQLALARDGHARVAVYDLVGRHVRTLVDGTLPAGTRTLAWDGRDDGGRPVAAGLYLVRFDAAGAKQSRRLVLMP